MKAAKWTAAFLVVALLYGISGSMVAADTVPEHVYGAASDRPVDTQQVARDAQKILQQSLGQSAEQAQQTAQQLATQWEGASVVAVVSAGLTTQDEAKAAISSPNQGAPAGDALAIFSKALGVATKDDSASTANQKAGAAGLTLPGDQSQPLTRLQAASLLAAAMRVQPDATAPDAFADSATMAPGDRVLLNTLFALGVFRGFPNPDGKPFFRTDATLTWAQVMVLVDRLSSH